VFRLCRFSWWTLLRIFRECPVCLSELYLAPRSGKALHCNGQPGNRIMQLLYRKLFYIKLCRISVMCWHNVLIMQHITTVKKIHIYMCLHYMYYLNAYPVIYHAHVFGAAGYIDGHHHSRSKGVHSGWTQAAGCRQVCRAVSLRNVYRFWSCMWHWKHMNMIC
jgi:hypothetical protein